MAVTRTIQSLQAALIEAIKKPDFKEAEDLAQQLLNQGGNLEFTDKDGLTPLLLAAKNRWGIHIRSLIHLGADVEAVDPEGNGILHIAAESRSLVETNNALELWSLTPVDVTAKNNLGQTIIHAAVKNPLNIFSLPYLQKLAEMYHVDFNLLDNNGKSACNLPNSMGVSPLYIVAINNPSLAMVKFLVENGADLTARDKSKALIWQVAVQLKSMDDPILQYLIAEGKITAFELEMFKAHRELFFGVDHPRINRCLETVDKPFLYESGGQPAESVRFLLANLLKFTDDPTLLAESYEAIKNFNQDGASLQYAGAEKHLTLAAIKAKTPPMKQLCLYDSGLFSVKASEGGIYSVRVLDFDEKYTKQVTGLIKKTKDCPQDESRDILFRQIPELTGSQYVYRTKKKPFKRGMCFYDNFKAFLLDELILKHGEIKGRLIYKKLDIFLHESAIQHFAEVSANSSHPRRGAILKIGADVVADKNRKLQTLYVKKYLEAQKHNPDELKILEDPELLKILNIGNSSVLLSNYQQSIIAIQKSVAEILLLIREFITSKEFGRFEEYHNKVGDILEKLMTEYSFLDVASVKKYAVEYMRENFSEYPIESMDDILNVLNLSVRNTVRNNIKTLFDGIDMVDFAYKKAIFLESFAEQIELMQTIRGNHGESLLVSYLIAHYNESKPEKFLALSESITSFQTLMQEVESKIDDSLKSISQKGMFSQAASASTDTNTSEIKNTKTLQ